MRLSIFVFLITLSPYCLGQSNMTSTLTPAHRDTIDTYTPLFTWSLGAQIQWDDRMLMKLKLCKKNGGQSDLQAISINTPLYYINTGFVNNHLYPFNANELEEGKTYVWQIELYSSDILIGSSNVARFTIPVIKNPVQFAALSKNYSGAIYTATNEGFYFRYEVKDRAGDVSFKVYNDQNELMSVEVVNVGSGTQSLDYLNYESIGENRYLVSHTPSLTPGEYRLIVEDQKGRVQKIRFEIQ